MHTTHFTCYKNTKYTALLHFVSEKFAITVLLKYCSLIIKLLHMNKDCAPVARQKFRSVKGMKKGVDPMTVQYMLKMIQKLNKTGSFDVQSGRGRKRFDWTIVEEVATAVQEESSGGAKPCSAEELPEHWNGL